MRFFLIGLSGLVALTAFGFYRLIPPFPDGIEHMNYGLKIAGAIYKIVFKAAIFAESVGLIEDSSISVRNLIYKMMPTNIDYKALRSPEMDFENTTIADLPVIIFRKSGTGDRLPGAVIYFHGGGYVHFNPWNFFTWTQKLAADTGAVVISVDYRLAPEFPCPVAIEDAIKVTKAIFDSAKELKIDPRRIMVAGDSAGALLSSIVAIELASSEKYHLKAQLLFSPAFQAIDTSALPSYKLYADIFTFPMHWYIAKYAAAPYSPTIHRQMLANQYVTRQDLEKYGHRLNLANLSKDIKALVSDHSFDAEPEPLKVTQDDVPNEAMATVRRMVLDERAWPLLIQDDAKLAKVAPVLINVAEFDPLRDETFLFYDRLRSLGVKVKLSFMPKGVHDEPIGIVAFNSPPTKAATIGINDAVAFIKEHLEL